MEMSYLLKGLLIGFSIAAPVGPIGILCVRRTLDGGLGAGVISGVGAATADALYGCVAGFGLTYVSGFLVSEQYWLRCLGGLFLLYLGVRTFRARPAESAAAAGGVGLAGAYASTFFLTVTNPLTVLFFGAIFAGLGTASRGYSSALLVVSGVFGGSVLWWLFLCGGTNLLRGRFGPRAMAWVNRASGITIFTFGALAMLSLVRG